MASKGLRERDLLVDLESGTNAMIDEQEGSAEIVSNLVTPKKFLNIAWTVSARDDGSFKDEEAGSSRNNLSNSIECPLDNEECLGDIRNGGEVEKVSFLEKKVGTEKPKKKGCKKPPKPPRPPKSPPLNAADQKLLREVQELAMLKRARTERMKAIKKMKNAKNSSPSSNLWAVVITVLFCLVIVWQGMSSQGATIVRFHGSPESSEGSRNGLISVQFYSNASNGDSLGSLSTSPSIMEEVSGLDGHEEHRVAG